METITQRCVEGCLSEQAMNPGLDLADSAMSACGRCSNFVCVSCQTAPVDEELTFCGPCADELAEQDYDFD